MLCQLHSSLVHKPHQPLHPVKATWPFSRWGLDIIGKINPPSAKGHTFMLVATESFDKWVEAVPLKRVTGINVAEFIRNNIIYRFGIPEYIVTDKGTPFRKQDLEELTQKFKIKDCPPKGNGQAEATNQTVIRILEKMVSSSQRDWHEKCPQVLWAYRVSPRTATALRAHLRNGSYIAH